jgi:hypothetical protein
MGSHNTDKSSVMNLSSRQTMSRRCRQCRFHYLFLMGSVLMEFPAILPCIRQAALERNLGQLASAHL